MDNLLDKITKYINQLRYINNVPELNKNDVMKIALESLAEQLGIEV